MLAVDEPLFAVDPLLAEAGLLEFESCRMRYTFEWTWKPLFMVKEQFKAGAAQVEPVFHDKEGTIAKACEWIEKAGNRDVDILVFPETFVPAYPYWRGCSISRWSELMVELQKNSLHANDPHIEVLQDAIADANVHVVLGANELAEQAGSETLYNSLFYFDRSGTLVRRHRKLMPTHEERAIWGRGDPSSLSTHETDIGRVGGLICYENHMTLSKAALAAMGEEIHPAVWPGFWEQNGHPGDKSKAESADAKETCDQYAAMREYAFETQSFVLSCSSYMSDDALAAVQDEIGFNVASGGSMLVNPAGIVKAGPVIGEEALITAEFSRDERRATKAYFDAVGHYSRWDAVNLNVNDNSLKPFEHGKSTATSKRNLSSAKIQEVAEEHDLSIEAVESIASEILASNFHGSRCSPENGRGGIRTLTLLRGGRPAASRAQPPFLPRKTVAKRVEEPAALGELGHKLRARTAVGRRQPRRVGHPICARRHAAQGVRNARSETRCRTRTVP